MRSFDVFSFGIIVPPCPFLRLSRFTSPDFTARLMSLRAARLDVKPASTTIWLTEKMRVFPGRVSIAYRFGLLIE
jgi:hypothetical protein